MIEEAIKSTWDECAKPLFVCALITLFFIIFVETLRDEIRQRKKNTTDRQGSKKDIRS